MQFILKLFRALNSAQTPWQVTLAITLGMIAGLTPLSGIQTVVIFFLAFLLNIHLGLFLASSAFFAGIGYLFDPVFEQVGYMLLTSKGLSGLWTTWYNNGLMRLSYFNNTLVLGSTVIAILAAVPLYFLLGWSIGHYRDALGSILSKFPRLGLFGILQASGKKDPLIRWWGAGVFAGVAAVIFAFTIFLADPLAKWALESGASQLLQRDVRVGSVDISFGKGAVDINRLEVAGSKEGFDAISMEHIGFDIDLNALLFNRTHIEKAAINGMGFQTKATLKKAVPRKDEDVPAQKLEEKSDGTFSMPTFELPDPKQVLANANLKSVKVYEKAQAEVARIRAKWDDVAKNEFSDKALKELENDYKALKRKASSKDPGQLLQLKDDLKAFERKLDQREKQIKSLEKEFNTDQKRIESLLAMIKNAPTQDFNHLKAKYSLDGKGAMNLVAILFSEKVKGYVAMADKYYTMLAPYIDNEPAPEEKLPPRGQGRWIKFALKVPNPDLLIRKTEIDGILDDQKFSATISDITDRQKELGRPITFKASSDGKQIRGLKLSGEDNRLGEGVVDRLSFSAKKFPLEEMALSSMTLSNAALAFNGDLVINDAKAMNGKANLRFRDADIKMDNLEGQTAKVVSDVLKSINRFNADVTLGGELDSPKVSVKTDLDKKLSSALSAGLKKQTARFEKDLKGLLDSQMKEQLGAFKGEASNIADINALAGSQSSALGNLNSNASGLITGGGLKKLLKF
ncbi:MAG: TIGR03545 family protein [Desulfobacterales bacterium]|nr:TIGR03545 family protein [Desulfobacterales bacterium]